MKYLAGLCHLSPNTVRRRVHAIGSWSDFMVRQGLLATNPARDLPLPPRERKLTRVPTPEPCERLLCAARTPLERVAIWLLATTGMRRAELVGLDFEDIGSEGTEIRVMGKGRRERLVPLPLRCQDVLHEYVAHRGGRDGPLLINRAGKRLGLTSLRRLFCRLLRRAGLDQECFTIHSLRHSYASMLVKAGVDLGTVRDLLGHSDISVTSVYVHSDLRSKRVAVEQLPVLTMGGAEDA